MRKPTKKQAEAEDYRLAKLLQATSIRLCVRHDQYHKGLIGEFDGMLKQNGKRGYLLLARELLAQGVRAPEMERATVASKQHRLPARKPDLAGQLLFPEVEEIIHEG